MKKLFSVLTILFLLIGMSGLATAAVLDFEDLTGSGAMPDPYHGIIDWEDGSWFHYDWEQDPYYPSSGIQRTYESTSDLTPSWVFLEDVTYQGSFFSGYDYGILQYELYLDGSLVHTSGWFVPSSTPTFFATNYTGLVDEVVINTPKPDYWVMDDLTYNEGAPVPEPATMLLFGLGLLGLAGVNRRKK